jgi:hypothetical protein
MNWLWIYWGAMLFVVLPFFLFGIPEFIAFKYGGPTFSRFMATIGNTSGAFGRIWYFLWGGLVFGLLVHFSGWCMTTCNGQLTGG